MSPAIGQQDWAALARAYGEAWAELLVYRRVCAEQAAEIASLHEQLVACADALHAPPDEPGEG